jgi:histidine triad (HIT) family protein
VADCTFCRIVRGELPADFRYQDDDVIAFKDLAPPSRASAASGRLRRSVPTCVDLGAPRAASRRRRPLAAITASRASQRTNTGPEGGQDVFHLHCHVYAGRPLPPLPRV